MTTRCSGYVVGWDAPMAAYCCWPRAERPPAKPPSSVCGLPTTSWPRGRAQYWPRCMVADTASRDAPVVLVTRPEGEAAEALCRSVRAAGFRVNAQPLMTILPISPLGPAQHQRVRQLDWYQHVIFVSANAVRAETPGDQMHSEGLLALSSLAAVEGQRVLIVKGEGGRDTIRRTLEGRGARVDELACYRRGCPSLAPGALAAMLERWAIDIVLISSGEGLCNFVELLRPAEPTNFSQLSLIAPSERVAELARAAGFDRIVTAANASDAAMLHALENCKPCHGG